MLNDFLKSGFKLEKLVNLKIFNKRIKADRFVFNRNELKLIGIFFQVKNFRNFNRKQKTLSSV